MSRFPDELTGLVEQSRADDEPTRADRDRVRRALFARLGAAVATGVAAPSASAAVTSAATASGLSLAAKVMIPVAVLAAAGSGVAIVRNQRAHSPRATLSHSSAVRAPAPVQRDPESSRDPVQPATRDVNTTVPTPPAVTIATSATVTAPTLTRRATARVASETEPPAMELANDLRVLKEADSALHAGNAHRALELLDHASSRGPLEQERTALRLIARCTVESSTSAQSAAASFLARHVDSPLAARISTTCKLSTERAASNDLLTEQNARTH